MYWSSNGGFLAGLAVKASACNAGDLGSIPGLGRSPGEGNGNPLQYSCMEKPMDRGAWWATVHGVAKCRTRNTYFAVFGHWENKDEKSLLLSPWILCLRSPCNRRCVNVSFLHTSESHHVVKMDGWCCVPLHGQWRWECMA